MRIQHNIMAMNAYRNYTNNTSALAKNLEKLSSGYKINRAGDDAAGLAISEKMRAQITGLETAQKNAKDGISLIQTAEGALTEVHDMLNRMVELADQSANGTYADEVDRENLQKEISALKDEINRIADSTNFNGIKLLDGSMGVSTSAISKITTNAYVKGGSSDAFTVEFGNERKAAVSTQQSAVFTVSLNDLDLKATTTGNQKVSITVGGQKLEVTVSGNKTGAQLAAALASGGGKTLSSADATNNTLTGSAGKYVKIDGNTYEMSVSGETITFTQKNKMAAGANQINPSFAVEVGKELSGDGSLSGKVNKQVQMTQAGVAAGAAEQARVDVKIDFSKLKDGDTLKFGNKTVTFKVGEGSSTTAGSTDGLVNLSTIFKTDADLADADKQAKAMVEITKAMGTAATATTDAWSVGNGGVSGGVGTLTLQSKSGFSDTAAIKMDTKDNVMAQFESTTLTRAASTTFEVDVTKIKEGDTISIGGQTFEFTNSANASDKNNVAINLNAFGIEDGIAKKDEDAVITAIKNAIDANAKYDASSTKYDVTTDGNKITLTSKDYAFTANVSEQKYAPEVKADTGLILQIGDTAESFNQMKVSVSDMHAAAMGIGDIDISTQAGAQAAVDKIKAAVNYVSSTRGDLGALQNRLEHTINNLSVTTENIQDAEASIRDVDVAKEMMDYTKNNILVQSAQAMLAQANQVPQGVLQLLQ